MDDRKQGGEEVHHKIPPPKGPLAAREEEILAFWNQHHIFKKSLKKHSPKGEYVFYDGPPFATGLPHYGHLLQSALKDAVPRYRTMQGYHVERRWGWDCHGLPLENLIEQELGFKVKRDIEQYGVEKFNEAARSAVLRYADDWKKIIPRFGRWVDMDNDYRTMDSSYTESVWWAFKSLYNKGLIYDGFKAMQFCPRCGTTLSNFEVAQGYKDIDDVAVTVRLPLVDEPGTSLLIWTTTAWTLPGNTAAAVNADATYVKVKYGDEFLILAKERMENVLEQKSGSASASDAGRGPRTFEREFSPEVIEEFPGKSLVGKRYEPPFDYFKNEIHKHKTHAFKVYAAPYVTMDSGTGIVHLAPAFGAEDLELAQKEKIPLIHHVTDEGKFIATVKDFAGLMAKPKGNPRETDEKIAAFLEGNGVLFKQEKIKHSYPHCWRCDTPLLNWAANSWFVKVASIKNKLIEENAKVNWVPAHVGTGRFNNLLHSAPDWAISRTRYWGAPIPVWKNSKTKEIKVVGSVEELLPMVRRSGNNYFVMRHGEARSNVEHFLNSSNTIENHLTDDGKAQVRAAALELKGKGITTIVVSPLTRTQETARVMCEELGIDPSQLMTDTRLGEVELGEADGMNLPEWEALFGMLSDKFNKKMMGGETYAEVHKRVGEFIFDIESRYTGKNILIVTHGTPAWLMTEIASYTPLAEVKDRQHKGIVLGNAAWKEVQFTPYPHNHNFELDLHRPYIDEVPMGDAISGKWERVPDVFDCWFESGSMPFAQGGYPKNKKNFDPKRWFGFGAKGYPADFIAESIDQTRGWFYSLVVLGVGLFGKSPYKTVVTNGLILAEDGRKMSKKLKNYPDPLELLEQYGADAIRYYLLSSPVLRGEDMRFSARGVEEVSKKLLMRLDNVRSFYELYVTEAGKVDDAATPSASVSLRSAQQPGIAASSTSTASLHVLDRWILSRLNELISETTKGYESFELDNATRPLGEFIDDLSTWYVRRSRDRIRLPAEKYNKQEDGGALATLRKVLRTTALVMAPTMPFFAEDLYQKTKEDGDPQSVHLCSWPEAGEIDAQLIKDMQQTRKIASVGLQLREKAGMKLRQPLALLKAKVIPSNDDLIEVLKDELNIKSIVGDESLETDAWIDTALTDELKEEGSVRDMVRLVQGMRKDKGLQMQDRPMLVVTANAVDAKLLEKYKDQLVSQTGLGGMCITREDAAELAMQFE
jgi:isoleucyl-tRNA synthetase